MPTEIEDLDHESLLQAMDSHLRKNGSYLIAHVEELIRRLGKHEAIAKTNRANPEPNAKRVLTEPAGVMATGTTAAEYTKVTKAK
jgi:hypothetical protein